MSGSSSTTTTTERDNALREVIHLILAKPLNPGTFGFIFSDRNDSEPIVVFPGESYLDSLERMGLDHKEIIDNGGETISFRLSDIEFDPSGIDFSCRGSLATLLARAFVVGLTTERQRPQRFAEKSALEDFLIL